MAQQQADITVTGRSLDQRRVAWEECLAGRCVPTEEIDRALNLAEAQVLAGDYEGGWTTLRTAKHRNLRYADTIPVPVARLVGATARLANLNGQPVTSRVGYIDSVDALKRGLDRQDDRVLVARLEIGDALFPEGRVEAALDQYRRVEREAKAGGRANIAALARYRYAAALTWLATGPRETRGLASVYENDAKHALSAIATSGEPAMAAYRDDARLLQVNFLPERNRLAAVERLLPTLTPRAADRGVVLVYAPAVDLARLVVDQPPPGEWQQWADIAFRIGADGRTREVAILKRSPHLPDQWVAAATAALGGRLYMPLALPPGDPGVRHVARVTFVTDAEQVTRSRLTNASAEPRVDIIDRGAVIEGS